MAYARGRRLPPNVPHILKVSVCSALALCALAGALVHAPAASAATPCWKALLNDWYDGRIDNTYPRHCYLDALKHLPADVQTYSSAKDDIQRALQSATAKARRLGHKLGPNTLIVPPRHGKKDKADQTRTGRKPEKGLTGLADQLNSGGGASSVPVPLLVLGGLAILLVAAGAAGLIAKRIQARRHGP